MFQRDTHFESRRERGHRRRLKIAVFSFVAFRHQNATFKYWTKKEVQVFWGKLLLRQTGQGILTKYIVNLRHCLRHRRRSRIDFDTVVFFPLRIDRRSDKAQPLNSPVVEPSLRIMRLSSAMQIRAVARQRRKEETKIMEHRPKAHKEH